MKLRLKGNEYLSRLIFYFVLYALITYPLFYFAYKFNLPKFGSSDIFHYLRMYQEPFNFSTADGPFVYRQLSAGIAHEINTPIQYINDNMRAISDYLVDIELLSSGYQQLLRELERQNLLGKQVAMLRNLEQEGIILGQREGLKTKFNFTALEEYI